GSSQHALKDKKVIDSGCSRHMTGNISYLFDFEEINEGYVTFGGNPKARKITGKGSGPTWLFDIDTLTQSMNYQPVVTGNQPNSNAGIQENFTAGTGGKEAESVQQYVLLPLWSSGSKYPQNTDAAAFDVKEPESAVYVSPSSYDKTKKHNDKTKREAKDKSPVTRVRDLSDDFEEFSDNSTNGVNAANTLVTTVRPNSTNSTNTFSAAGPSNNVVSLNFELGRKSSYVDPSQYPDDPDMPALEYITYSDDEEDVEEPKRVHQALKDPSWIKAMQEELLQFKMQKGHTQEEGIDYEEVFALVERIEAIRLFLAYDSFMGFMVYQIDVKSAFLYGTIKEEVYVCQPLGFKDSDYPDKVYKVVKAL
nr:hypothetical protein [Tanacetum cinerariifolium]